MLWKLLVLGVWRSCVAALDAAEVAGAEMPRIWGIRVAVVLARRLARVWGVAMEQGLLV